MGQTAESQSAFRHWRSSLPTKRFQFEVRFQTKQSGSKKLIHEYNFTVFIKCASRKSYNIQMHWRRGEQTEAYNTAHYIGWKNHHRSCSYKRKRPRQPRKHTIKVILPSFPSTGFDTSISKLSCSCWPLKRLRCSCSIRLLSSSSRGCHVPSINHCPRITGIFSVSKKSNERFFNATDHRLTADKRERELGGVLMKELHSLCWDP